MTASQPVTPSTALAEQRERRLEELAPEILASLPAADTPPPFETSSPRDLKSVGAVDKLVSLSEAAWLPPLPAPLKAPFEGGNLPGKGQIAGLGALLAPQECEPGDIPSAQLTRNVIQRESDRVEVAVEPRLSPQELNLADLWLRSDFGDWMSIDHLPSGHPKKRALAARAGIPLRLNSLHRKVPKNNMKMLSLLTLLSKSLRPIKKRYVVGQRGELLDEDDEQLLGNTDVMVLPYSPPPPFTVEDAEDLADQRKKRAGDRHRRQKDREAKQKKNSGKSPPLPGTTDADELVRSTYESFDVFDFFENLLSRNAPGSKNSK